MTVKILLDPILTAMPSRCSTFIQFVTFMERTLAARQDVFFYCLLPDWDMPQEELDWLPKHPNIQYVRVPQHKDRTKEYVTLRNEMDELIAFNGRLWDFDILVTVRSGLAALYRMRIMSPRQVQLGYLKEVWVIEDMPLMSFKSSVLQLAADGVQDRFTLDGYLAADRVMVMSYHEKGEALKIARQFYAPSQVVDLDTKLKEVIPVQFEDFKKKDPQHFFKPGAGRFTVAYVGRLMAATTNIDKIYSAMTKSWIIRKGDNVRMVVCTNSAGGKKRVQPPDYMEKYYAPREEFWRMAREEMHVLMIMHEEAGFLLSMMEPVMLGTPVIVKREPWSLGQLGRHYPFYVNNEFELYALAKMFYEDYAGMYAKFEHWFDEWFVPTYTRRFQQDLLYTVLGDYLDNYDKLAMPMFGDNPTHHKNPIVDLLLKDDPDEIVIMEKLEQLAAAGELRSLYRQLGEDDRDVRGLIWATPWDTFRRVMKLRGYEDASPKTGHMRKISSTPAAG